MAPSLFTSSVSWAIRDSYHLILTLIQYLFNNTPQLLDYVFMRLSKLTSQFYGIKLVIMTMIILIKYDEINRELGL